jgi:hypothetical protein
MTDVHSIEPEFPKAPLPANDRGRGGLQPMLNGVERRAFCQQEDQLGAKHVSGRQGAGLGNGAEVGMLGQNLSSNQHQN